MGEVSIVHEVAIAIFINPAAFIIDVNNLEAPEVADALAYLYTV